MSININVNVIYKNGKKVNVSGYHDSKNIDFFIDGIHINDNNFINRLLNHKKRNIKCVEICYLLSDSNGLTLEKTLNLGGLYFEDRILNAYNTIILPDVYKIVKMATYYKFNKKV